MVQTGKSGEASERKTSPSWSPGNLRHSPYSPLVLLPSGSDTVRRTTMHRARAPCRAHRRPYGGEGGIRTRGGVTPTHAFQACSFGLSDTSPLIPKLVKEIGGEEGIRTLGPRERSTVFETAPIDHSGTSPHRGGHSTTNRGAPYRFLSSVPRDWASPKGAHHGAQATCGTRRGPP